MMIHAYDELYLDSAQRILGDAFDYALMTLQMEPELFQEIFLHSLASRQFAGGNPSYVAGITGCEFVRKIVKESGLELDFAEDVMYVDKSPEYWAGWALAYYQWLRCCSFRKVLEIVPVVRIIEMYPTFHEIDIQGFVAAIDERIRQRYRSNLAQLRERVGISVSDLSKNADISIKQLEALEQGEKELGKLQASTLYRLSRALHCSMEELMY